MLFTFFLLLAHDRNALTNIQHNHTNKSITIMNHIWLIVDPLQ